MRRMGMRLIAALGVLLGVSLPSSSAGAQAAGAGPALEGFYTRVGFDGGGRTVRAGGVGGRLMWPLAARGGAEPAGASWLTRRAAVGVFGATTPDAGRGFSAGQFGVAADLTPWAAPIAGRVEPFLSLGAGALRTTARVPEPGVRLAARPETRVPAASVRLAAPGERTVTDFLLVPTVGARVQLRPGVAAQGDVRQLVTFRGDRRQHHPAFGTGVRLSF